MAPSDQSAANSRTSKASGDADLAQAYRDLARGEQAATALEANLSNLESKLDAILAALEAKSDPQTTTAAAATAKIHDRAKILSQADGGSAVQDSAGQDKDKDEARDKEDVA
ncbi:hypothetical protein ACJ41O_004405 [Fusarium nematophilum]